MIQRVEDLIRDPLMMQILLSANEYSDKHLGGKPWIEIESEPDNPVYKVKPLVPDTWEPFLRGIIQNGADWIGCLSAAMWMRNPRVARPNKEQVESFANISFGIEVNDFSSPFPAMLVETPECGPFFAVIVYQMPGALVLNLFSSGGLYDIVTTIRHAPNTVIEESLNRLDEDVDQSILVHSVKAQRVALNMCMALTNYGFEDKEDNPHNASQDRQLAKEDSERGARARERIRRGVMRRVTFSHEIVIRRSVPRDEPYNSTGRRMPPHWVRGHWKKQPYGPKNSLSKSILIKPYVVHWEEAAGINPDVVIYKDAR